MEDIQQTPLEELEKDLLEAVMDYGHAQMALVLGIAVCSTGLDQDRIDVNLHYIEAITREIQRRCKHRNVRLADDEHLYCYVCGRTWAPENDFERRYLTLQLMARTTRSEERGTWNTYSREYGE